jgi:hypothetical protein
MHAAVVPSHFLLSGPPAWPTHCDETATLGCRRQTAGWGGRQACHSACIENAGVYGIDDNAAGGVRSGSTRCCRRCGRSSRRTMCRRYSAGSRCRHRRRPGVIVRHYLTVVCRCLTSSTCKVCCCTRSFIPLVFRIATVASGCSPRCSANFLFSQNCSPIAPMRDQFSIRRSPKPCPTSPVPAVGLYSPARPSPPCSASAMRGPARCTGKLLRLATVTAMTEEEQTQTLRA